MLDVPANMADEEDIVRMVDAHRERFGRLDVLVNNAGRRHRRRDRELETKKLDMQLDVNLRAVILDDARVRDLPRAAGAEHRGALVVNTASIAGKAGRAWLSVYSATKAAVIGVHPGEHKELAGDGIESTALCPGFVDTPMTDFVKGQVDAADMIQARGRRRGRCAACCGSRPPASSRRCSSCGPASRLLDELCSSRGASRAAEAPPAEASRRGLARPWRSRRRSVWCSAWRPPRSGCGAPRRGSRPQVGLERPELAPGRGARARLAR